MARLRADIPLYPDWACLVPECASFIVLRAAGRQVEGGGVQPSPARKLDEDGESRGCSPNRSDSELFGASSRRRIGSVNQAFSKY